MSRVYVLVDEKSRVIQIEGEATLSNIPDLKKAVLVEEGKSCPRLDCAQALYLDGPLTDDNAVFRYKLDGRKIVHRTDAEIAADLAEKPHDLTPSLEERISDLEIAICEIFDAL